MQTYFILQYAFDASTLSYAIKNSVPSSQVKHFVAIAETTCVLLERDMIVDDHKNRLKHVCITHTE